MTAAGSPRWRRRIGFRMALMLTLLLLGGAFVLPLVWNLALGAAGLPTLDQEIVELSDPEDARLLPLHDLQFVAAHLLEGATPIGGGTWRPDPDRAAAVERSLAAWGQTYAWLSADREVLACSAELPLTVGEPLRTPLGRVEPETAAPPFGDVTLGRIATYVEKDGEVAGWLVIYGEPPLGVDAGGGVVVEGGTAVRAWSNRVVNVVGTVFVILAAAVTALAVSRLVTGRVTRLARAAAAPIGDPHQLPGPFPVEGEDELAQLAGTLNGMRDKIAELVADLDHKDRERRRWIAQVSHDLRTPLTALTACLDGARNELASPRLDAARHDAARLAELIEDLLDIARLEAGDEPVTEPVPPGELARQAARGLEPLAEQGGVALSLDLEPGLPLLEADGRRLMRALENLLKNALHHAHGAVTLRATREDGAVRFTVEDDGDGMPSGPDGVVDVEALTDHLSRPDSAGLGLVVVRKVAEAHGGRIGAESHEGEGARVWFDVPVTG